MIKLSLEEQEKCTLCPVCTHHIYDRITNSWSRCSKTNISVFFPQIKSIPPKYIHSDWDSFLDDNPLRKKAKDIVTKIYQRIALEHTLPKSSVILSGRELSGKTMLASILSRALLLNDISAQIVSLPILVDLYFNNKAEFEKFESPICLTIQMGNEIPNTAVLFAIQELFERRSHLNHYTLFTSKFKVSEFGTHYSKEMQNFFSLSIFKELPLK